MTKWRSLFLAALLTVSLSACGLRTWVDVDIAADSSGSVTVQLASDQELRDGLATFSPDTDVVAELSRGLADEGWNIEPSPEDGEWEGIVASKSFADLEELARLLEQATQGGESSISVTETDDAYVLSAELGPPGGDANQQQLFDQAAEVIDVDGRLTVRFPGPVTATNGEVGSDGSTVVWTYDEDTIVGFTAEAEATRVGVPVIWIVAGGSVVAAGVAAALLLRRRHRRSYC